MTHHHFKKFGYSFAGLALTYVAAIVFYALVLNIIALNQNPTPDLQILGTSTKRVIEVNER